MFTVEQKENEVAITFGNKNHQIVCDSRGFTIKVKTFITDKETGDKKETYTPIYYYTSLRSCVNQLCKLKMMSKRETVDIRRFCQEFIVIKSEMIDEIGKAMENLIITKEEINK